MTDTLRLEQIAEAMADLEATFADPEHPGSADDAAVSLASEFVGQYRDDEITHRLAQFIEAEAAGQSNAAYRHLRFIRRKLNARWPVPGAAKDQVAETPSRPGAPHGVRVGPSTGLPNQRATDARQETK